MSRTTFTDGQVLMAAQLQSLHDQGGITVSSTAEMSALPTSVKTCWYNGLSYKRRADNAWIEEGADKAPKNGVGTSGTWPISITGKAATATSATNATNAVNATNATNATNLTSMKVGRAGPFPIGADQSTGNINITHGLGKTPKAVFVSADDDGGDCTVFASVESFNATTVVAQMRNIGAAETGVYINWLVF